MDANRKTPIDQGIAAVTMLLICTSTAALAAGPSLSTCTPVDVSAVHVLPRSGENPFLRSQRLALIEGGTVACLDGDSLAADRCTFHTEPGADDGTGRHAQASGHWVLDSQGRRYAMLGQSLARDGGRVGRYVVAAPIEQGSVACIEAPRQRDMAGVASSEELTNTCVVEVMGSAQNALRRPLRNYATIPVCTSSYPHPDGARLVSADRTAGVYCYAGEGAGLNDRHGQERDANGSYLRGYGYCHVGWSGGFEVWVGKRPGTNKQKVNVKSPIVWRPVVPVRIAN